MTQILKPAVAIVLATAWISASGIRNELLFKSYWVEHYGTRRHRVPLRPGQRRYLGKRSLWSLLFATVIFLLAKNSASSRRF